MIATLFRGRQSVSTDVVAPQEPRLPQDTLVAIMIALKASQDKPPELPSGWRGYYVGIADETSPGAADRVPIGSEVRFVPDARRPEHAPAIRVMVDLPDQSTGPARLPRRGPRAWAGIALGQVRGWFAGRMPTVNKSGGRDDLYCGRLGAVVRS